MGGINTLEIYGMNLNASFKSVTGEGIENYDNELFNIYMDLYNENSEIFEQTLNETCIDLEESGAYWKTVQRMDANLPEAYVFELKPSADVKKE
jgi:hypothetical protein